MESTVAVRRPRSCFADRVDAPGSPRPRIERFLNAFVTVRPGEATTALLLALNVFLILLAYYVLKTVREALILGEGSAELKSYLSAAQVVLLAGLVPFYGRLVAALSRIRLINVVTAVFAACPIVFFVLSQYEVPLAIVFFIWVGIFSLMIVAQFWAFANDLYTKEQGERLLVIVGFGASLGAVAGARVADRLIGPLDIDQLMLVGAGVLFASLAITNVIHKREGPRGPAVVPMMAPAAPPNAFALVMQTRFLLLMGVMLMLMNLVNTTGEYILGSLVKETAVAMVADGRSSGLSEEQLIGDFYSKFFTIVNVAGLLLQLFVVSRLVKYLGVPIAVMILPIIALGAYNVMAIAPTLWLVLGAKVAENSTDYSLNNTVRQMLFLPCSYDEKFSGKQVIDAFFVRIGDVLSAGLVFMGSLASLAPRRFAVINAVLTALWLIVAWRVGRHYAARTAPVRTSPRPHGHTLHAERSAGLP
jgi:ATP:ADP antiporter, AAA family